MPSFVPTNLVCLAHACSPSTCRAVSSQQPTSLHTLLLLQIQTWPRPCTTLHHMQSFAGGGLCPHHRHDLMHLRLVKEWPPCIFSSQACPRSSEYSHGYSIEYTRVSPEGQTPERDPR